ncbi:MAG: hypothetical protein IJ125_06955 [Atopobiaceae bacterium]|nr:hypothetical protein [Atopobiaceae bacterium]
MTDTKNHSLAEALSFSTSYISRIRTGKRGFPNNQYFIKPAASFFAERLVDSYNTRAVAELVCPGKEWPASVDSASRLIENWLGADDTTLANVKDIILGLGSDLSALQSPVEYYSHKAGMQASPHSLCDLVGTDGVGVCYGNEGKRRCISAFLEHLATRDYPVHLYMYSSESRTWAHEDPGFVQKRFAQFYRILSHGGCITMVHGLSRDLDAMFQEIQRWLPLYIMGNVNSFWSDRFNGGIVKRTQYVAPDIAAVSATSMGETTEGMASFVYADPQTVAAQELEFKRLIDLCEPLVRRYMLDDFESCVQVVDTFLSTKEELIIAMSEDLKDGIKKLMPAEYINTLKRFDIEFTDDTSDWQSVRWVAPDKLPSKLCVVIKEGLGVCVLRLADPQMLFVVTEERFTGYFTEYVKRL